MQVKKNNFLLLKYKYFVLIKFFVENFYRKSEPEMHHLSDNKYYFDPSNP